MTDVKDYLAEKEFDRDKVLEDCLKEIDNLKDITTTYIIESRESKERLNALTQEILSREYVPLELDDALLERIDMTRKYAERYSKTSYERFRENMNRFIEEWNSKTNLIKDKYITLS